MQIYHTKIAKLKGTDYHEVCKRAHNYYSELNRGNRRKPYARSAYFNKSKIFLELFWHHLFEKKNRGDRIRRLKFLPCAIDLIRKSHCAPISKDNPNKHGELLHRFTGYSLEKDCFFIQIKEEKKSDKKWLISIFPADE
jgi:hypothetical protein